MLNGYRWIISLEETTERLKIFALLTYFKGAGACGAGCVISKEHINVLE